MKMNTISILCKKIKNLPFFYYLKTTVLFFLSQIFQKKNVNFVIYQNKINKKNFWNLFTV